MLIVYASKTHQVERFVGRLDMKSVNIKDVDVVDEPFVLVTYTTGFGEVPQEVKDFLQANRKNLVAVAASGNRNWRDKFARAANIISHDYSVPILLKFELQGTDEDVETFTERVHRIAEFYKRGRS